MKEKNVTNEQLAELINNLRGEIKDLKESENGKGVFYSIIKRGIEDINEKIGGLRIEISDLKK